MSKSKIVTPQFDTKVMEDSYQYLSKNDIRTGIVVAIKLFGSLNLKNLAHLLEKSESTTIPHLKSLEKRDLIKIDAQATGQGWGKFYTTTDLADAMIEYRIREFVTTEYEDKINEIRDLNPKELKELYFDKLKSEPEVYKRLPNQLRSISAMNKNIQHFIAKGFESFVEQSLEAKSPDEIEIPLGTLGVQIHPIKVSKLDHIVKLHELTNQYLKDLHKLEEEIKDETMIEGKDVKDLVTQYIYLFFGPLDRTTLLD